MKIEIDFEGMLQQALEKAVAPENIQPIVQKKMDELVASVLNEMFGFQGPLRKMMVKLMVEATPATLDNMSGIRDLVESTAKQSLNDAI